MRSVVITGGTVRLGAVIAERFRTHGWRVITVSHRADAQAEVTADFREETGAARCYAAVLGLNGGQPPDALVNNAALFSGSEKDIDAVNHIAAKKLTILMAGRETEGRGVVVNILDARRRQGAYGESKERLREWTKKSAVMFASTLRVNAVSPGAVMRPSAVHEKAGATLIGRPRAEDVAMAVVMLAENESITGAELAVDGGATLAEEDE